MLQLHYDIYHDQRELCRYVLVRNHFLPLVLNICFSAFCETGKNPLYELARINFPMHFHPFIMMNRSFAAYDESAKFIFEMVASLECFTIPRFGVHLA